MAHYLESFEFVSGHLYICTIIYLPQTKTLVELPSAQLLDVMLVIENASRKSWSHSLPGQQDNDCVLYCCPRLWKWLVASICGLISVRYFCQTVLELN